MNEAKSKKKTAEPPPEPDRLVSMKDAARLLGMPASTFWEKHISLGLIPMILHDDLRSKYRWSTNEIYALIAMRKRERDASQTKRRALMDSILQKI